MGFSTNAVAELTELIKPCSISREKQLPGDSWERQERNHRVIVGRVYQIPCRHGLRGLSQGGRVWRERRGAKVKLPPKE